MPGESEILSRDIILCRDITLCRDIILSRDIVLSIKILSEIKDEYGKPDGDSEVRGFLAVV